MVSKSLVRTFIHVNQQCNKCGKELKKKEVAWICGREEGIKGFIVDEQAKYYCISCGNKIVEQDRSPEKMSGEVCFALVCKNKIKKEYYQCRDSKKKFCSQRHFEEVYGIYCSCCGKEINEQFDYLEKVRPEKTAFQKVLPWAGSCTVILMTVVMLILVKKEEKKKNLFTE